MKFNLFMYPEWSLIKFRAVLLAEKSSWRVETNKTLNVHHAETYLENVYKEKHIKANKMFIQFVDSGWDDAFWNLLRFRK